MASEAAVIARQQAILSMRDVIALADRLEARAKSALSVEPASESSNDMWLAALALRAMMRAHHYSDVLNVAA